jgi:hypothetical protein
MNPLISVIMPVYNCEHYVEAAMASVQAQTHSHWELLVVDDGSLDHTAERVRAAMATDSRIKLLRLEHTGQPGRVRNAGLLAAQGDYLTFLDGDDLYLPHALATLLAPFQDGASAVYAFECEMNETGHLIKSHPPGLIATADGYQLAPSSEPTWENVLLGTLPHCLNGLMISRHTLKRVGLFNPEHPYAEDKQYKIRLFLDAFEQVTLLPEVTFCVRIRPTSMTKTLDRLDLQLASESRFLDWLYTQAGIPEPMWALRPEHTTHTFRRTAGIRLANGQPHVARRILRYAWSHPQVPTQAWLRRCALLYARTYLPLQLDSQLKRLLQRAPAPRTA